MIKQANECTNTARRTKPVALLTPSSWLAKAPGADSLNSGAHGPRVAWEKCFQCSGQDCAKGEEHLCRSKNLASNEIRGTSKEEMTERTQGFIESDQGIGGERL